MKKSGILNKLFITLLLFSGCALIRHTPKPEKNINLIFTNHPRLRDSLIVKYRTSGNGISLSGILHVNKKDSILQAKTTGFLVGTRTYKLNINNTGYPMLEFAIKYVYDISPFPKFIFSGMKNEKTFLFLYATDTIEAVVDDARISLIRDKKNYIQFFYGKKNSIEFARGRFEGFEFEGKIIQ